MLKLRWYEAQLDRLPTDSKEKMSQELLRGMHRGSLPKQTRVGVRRAKGGPLL